jgi:3',5'-cyclic AMP phosphodiesterase CpdA
MLAIAALVLLSADLRFAVVGDNTGRAKPGVHEAVWREIDKLKPAFAINIGDMIEGLDDAKVDAQWNAFAPLMSSLGKYPRYFVAGNHDIWSAKSRAAFEKFNNGRPATYSFDSGGIHVTVVDNSQTESLSPQQIDFLEKDLAANQSKELRFVFFHKPYWLIPLKLRSLNMPLHLTMKKYKVHSVFSGHLHQMHRIEREGVLYWCVPSSGGDLRGNSSFDQGWFYGYLVGDVKQGKANFTVHQLPAPFGEGRVLDAQKWGENGPAAPPAPGGGMPK